MCFRIFGKCLPFSAPSMGPSNTVTSLTENLQDIFTDEAQVKKYFLCDDDSYNVNKDHLIRILNKIAETKTGCNILKALKSALGNPPDNKQIVFNVCDQLKTINAIVGSDEDPFKSMSEVNNFIKRSQDEELKQQILGYRNKCAFVSEEAFKKRNVLFVNINEHLINEERYIFDKNKITTHEFPANEKSEAYFIAHELTHIISFLNSGITNEADWKLRKGELTGRENNLEQIQQDAGWVDFFNETEQMKAVYHGLLLDGFTPKQIIDTFRTFFLIQKKLVMFWVL